MLIIISNTSATPQNGPHIESKTTILWPFWVMSFFDQFVAVLSLLNENHSTHGRPISYQGKLVGKMLTMVPFCIPMVLPWYNWWLWYFYSMCNCVVLTCHIMDLLYITRLCWVSNTLSLFFLSIGCISPNDIPAGTVVHESYYQWTEGYRNNAVKLLRRRHKFENLCDSIWE